MTGLRGRDRLGLALVAAAAAGLVVFRQSVMDADAWEAACATAAPPWPCAVREAMFWAQSRSVWGIAALACGVWAMLGGPFAAAVAGVICGIGGAENYNVTWGVLGGSLAGWAWLRPAGADRSARPAPAPPRSTPALAGSKNLPAPRSPPPPG